MPRGKSVEQLATFRSVADAHDDARLFGPHRQMPTAQPMKVLVSFHYYKKTDLDALSRDLTTANGPPLMFADSGAFSAYTMGAAVDLGEYAQWVRRWEHLWNGNYVNLDVIGDAKATAANQRRLEKSGLAPIPVIHGGTPLAYVRGICERHRYVALGGMVSTNTTALLRWLVGCFKAAEKTGTVFHGFGQTKVAVISTLPWFSVDSTSWASGYRYGIYPYWSPSESRVKRVTTNATANKGAQPVPDEARRQFRSAGVPVEAATDRHHTNHHLYAARAAAWAWWQLEGHLRRLHGPIVMHPERNMSPGLHLYLVTGATAAFRASVL
jgi:hypothetical protein